MTATAPSVVVVGAGIAGLAAARSLHDDGHRVQVVDKGRSVGGRLATRRIGEATLDHGAPFVTSGGPELDAVIGELEADGLLREWRGARGPSGSRRYAVEGGMNQLAKRLAHGLDVTVDTVIETVAAGDGRWALRSASREFTADAVVLTPPVPQSLAIVDAGGVDLASPVRDQLDAIRYERSLVLLVVLSSPPRAVPGGVLFDEGPFRIIVDNHAKGISSEPAVTLQLGPELSAALWDSPPDEVLDELLARADRWLGHTDVVAAQVKRWRYAEATAPSVVPIVATTVEGSPLVFAGDAFAGGGVAGAHRSGRTAADHLVARLGDGPA